MVRIASTIYTRRFMGLNSFSLNNKFSGLSRDFHDDEVWVWYMVNWSSQIGPQQSQRSVVITLAWTTGMLKKKSCFGYLTFH